MDKLINLNGRRITGKILKTVGYTTIAIGIYLVHKGSELDATIDINNIIDAEFEILED